VQPVAELRFVGPVERLMYLRTLPLFGTLPARALAILARFAHEREFRRGDVLVAEGTPVSALYILVSGSVKVSRGGQAFRMFGPRDAVGVVGLLARTDDGVRAEALEDCVALEIHAAPLYRIFDEHFDIFLHVVRETAQLLLSERGQLGLGPGAAWPSAEVGDREPGDSLDLADRMKIISGALPFANTHPLALTMLARAAEELQVAGGEVVFRADQPAELIYIPVRASISCAADGGLVAPVSRGDVTGLVKGLAGACYGCRGTAQGDLTVLVLSREAVLDVIEDHMPVGFAMLAGIAGELLDVFMRRAEIEHHLPSGLEPTEIPWTAADRRGEVLLRG
jgi:CRP-like cAMP-binding protein